jgi:hypothetical protein
MGFWIDSPAHQNETQRERTMRLRAKAFSCNFKLALCRTRPHPVTEVPSGSRGRAYCLRGKDEIRPKNGLVYLQASCETQCPNKDT